MTMENGQWENSTETLAAYRPSLLFSSPHRPREEGHTYSPCPGPTMGTQAKQTKNRKTRAKTRLIFPTKSNSPNAVKTFQESVITPHPPKNKVALSFLGSVANIGHDALRTDNLIPDCKNDRTQTPLPTLEHEQREEMQGIQKDLLPKIFLQLRENCYGSPSFTKQHEKDIIKSALVTLALCHKSLKPEQTECQTNLSYTSVANLTDFKDLNSYTDKDILSYYSTISDLQ